MDAQAIEKIERLALAANRALNLEEYITPAIVLGDKVVSLEHLQAQRSRFRGKVNTSVLADFAEYVLDSVAKAEENTPPPHVFIDAESMKATAFLNVGNRLSPGHADWTAALHLKPLAAYAAVRAIDGTPQSQRGLAEWIEDWAANLAAIQGEDESMPLKNAVASIREITISAKSDVTSSDRNFGAARSAMEEIEAKAKNGLPTYLTFTTPPYLGFAERTLRLRLSVITGDKPALTLRIVGREKLEEIIAEEFKTLLGNALPNVPTTIGTFAPQ